MSSFFKEKKFSRLDYVRVMMTTSLNATPPTALTAHIVNSPLLNRRHTRLVRTVPPTWDPKANSSQTTNLLFIKTMIHQHRHIFAI